MEVITNIIKASSTAIYQLNIAGLMRMFTTGTGSGMNLKQICQPPQVGQLIELD